MAAPDRSTGRSPASSGSTCAPPTCTASTTCPTCTHHEAIPGHVWQGEYSNQLPLIRTMLAFNAYSEGWALYAEQLADELGVYDDFAVGRLGYLQSPRLPRLPAGGRHRPPRQALDPRAGRSLFRRAQRLEARGSGERSRPLLQLAGPGLRLQGRPQRDRPPARPRQGGARRRATTCEAFDDTVVKGGNVPLDVLAKNVDEYIRTAKA